MKILVIGSGGREHALVWKISQSPKVEKIFCAPGSAAIGELAECVAIGPEQIEKLADFAGKEKIDLANFPEAKEPDHNRSCNDDGSFQPP